MPNTKEMPKCQYVMQRGNREGEICGKSAYYDENTACASHRSYENEISAAAAYVIENYPGSISEHPEIEIVKDPNVVQAFKCPHCKRLTEL